MTARPIPSSPSLPLAGIAWMALSGLAFVGVNGVVKALGTDLPAAQSAFLRFAFGVVFFLPMLPRILRSGYPAQVWWMFGWRGAIHVVAVILWFHAMTRIPLAEVSAIGFLNPVLVLILAGLLLGEGLPLRRVAVVAAALAGAAIALRPGFRDLSDGHLAQLGAATCFAISYIIARRLSLVAPAGVVVAMMSFVVTLGLLPLAWRVWVPVSLQQVAALAVVAALATLAHYAMTRAFRAAPLGVTQPVVFLQILWASILGATAFDEPVDLWVILGGAVIIAAISVNSWAEMRPGRPAPPPDEG